MQPLVAAEDYWMPYQIARAEYIPFQQRLAQEQQIYFVPSVIEGEKYSGSFDSKLIIIIIIIIKLL